MSAHFRLLNLKSLCQKLQMSWQWDTKETKQAKNNRTCQTGRGLGPWNRRSDGEGAIPGNERLRGEQRRVNGNNKHKIAASNTQNKRGLTTACLAAEHCWAAGCSQLPHPHRIPNSTPPPPFVFYNFNAHPNKATPCSLIFVLLPLYVHKALTLTHSLASCFPC